MHSRYINSELSPFEVSAGLEVGVANGARQCEHAADTPRAANVPAGAEGEWFHISIKYLQTTIVSHSDVRPGVSKL